jgi:hypothetical protein
LATRIVAGSATPRQERTMWKPSVNAICSRAASRFEADAASGSGSRSGMALRLAAEAAADSELGHTWRRER